MTFLYSHQLIESIDLVRILDTSVQIQITF